jgi:transcriptional regulator with XRE-family HTH domain
MQDPVIVRKKLGDRIRYLRRKKDWSQERLAHESGLGRSFTGAIERGEKDLRIRTLCKLAAVFKVPFSVLMDGVDDFSYSSESKAKRLARKAH